MIPYIPFIQTYIPFTYKRPTTYKPTVTPYKPIVNEPSGIIDNGTKKYIETLLNDTNYTIDSCTKI